MSAVQRTVQARTRRGRRGTRVGFLVSSAVMAVAKATTLVTCAARPPVRAENLVHVMRPGDIR